MAGVVIKTGNGTGAGLLSYSGIWGMIVHMQAADQTGTCPSFGRYVQACRMTDSI